MEKTFNEIFNSKDLNILDVASRRTGKGDIEDTIMLEEDGKVYKYQGLRFTDEVYEGTLVYDFETKKSYL